VTLAVFFPSLMGVGIIISGALLISDWIRRLLPNRALKRQHNVIVGTYGAVADAVGAAGYHLKEPWFLRRGLRRRRTYFAVATVFTAGAFGAMEAGEAFHDDPLGVFFLSPWAVGIGYGTGAALLTVAAFALFLGLAYRSTPKSMMPLVSGTPFGEFILPSEADYNAALNTIEVGDTS